MRLRKLRFLFFGKQLLFQLSRKWRTALKMLHLRWQSGFDAQNWTFGRRWRSRKFRWSSTLTAYRELELDIFWWWEQFETNKPCISNFLRLSISVLTSWKRSRNGSLFFWLPQKVSKKINNCKDFLYFWKKYFCMLIL